MTLQVGDKITIKVHEVFSYGVIGKFENHRVYVDLNELSWKMPIPEHVFPKVSDQIEVVVIHTSQRPDSDYLGSVRHLTPDRNPWYDPSIYKVGDEFVGKIDAVNSFGCWAVHPRGADVRLLVNGLKYDLQVGQEIRLRIKSINERHKSIDAEIIK